MRRFTLVLLCAWIISAAGDGPGIARAAKPGRPAQPTKSAPSAAAPKANKAKKAPPRPQNDAPAGTSESERTLQADLDAALIDKTFKATKLGMVVIDVTTGRELYSHGADEQLNPASNVKLVSTATALQALGPDFTYDTTLFGPAPDAGGVVRGDVWLVGMGDPTLRDEHLAKLGPALAVRGALRVTGALVISDDAERDALAHPKIDVIVTGRSEGDLAQVTIAPDSAYFVVDTTALTRKKAPVKKTCKTVRVGKKREKRCSDPEPSGISVELVPGSDERGPHVVVRISGAIRPGMRFKVRKEAPHPAILTGHSVRAHLRRAGVRVDGNVRVVPLDQAPPAGLSALAVHHSAPLAELVARVNKPSNNWLADRVLRLVGARLYGRASLENGVKAMHEFLTRAGVRIESVMLENGSGLSYKNHLSARDVARVLLQGLKDARSARAFIASLAIGGVDGTIKGRFAGHDAAGYVFAKTGTLTGVAALSGFVSVDGEHLLCFAILTNGYKNGRKTQIRAGQVRMVDAMFRHMKRTATRVAAPATPPSGDLDVTPADDAAADPEVNAPDAPDAPDALAPGAPPPADAPAPGASAGSSRGQAP